MFLSDSDFQRLVSRCSNLPPARQDYRVSDYVENLFLTVLDFQMDHVAIDRAIAYYRQNARKGIANSAALKDLLDEFPDTEAGNGEVAKLLWNNRCWSRVGFLRRLLEYFEMQGVTTQEGLQQWVFRAASDANLERDIRTKSKVSFPSKNGKKFYHSVGDAIFKWLLIRQGVETVKPDTHIHRFILETIGHPVSNQEAVKLLEKTAREIGVKAYELDWSIWEYQRGLSRKG